MSRAATGAADGRPGGARPVLRRRDLLATAGAAALARTAPAAAADRHPAILTRLVAREEAAALAHEIAGVAPGLAPAESDHAKALRTELAALGREGPPPPRRAAALDGPAARLAFARTLDAAIELEAALLAAYRRALPELTEPSILRTAGTILASHAQHRALLCLEAGRDPLA